MHSDSDRSESRTISSSFDFAQDVWRVVSTDFLRLRSGRALLRVASVFSPHYAWLFTDIAKFSFPHYCETGPLLLAFRAALHYPAYQLLNEQLHYNISAHLFLNAPSGPPLELKRGKGEFKSLREMEGCMIKG